MPNPDGDLPGTWSELLGREFGGVTTVLASGVALYAINEFITISMMPSVIADIGGTRIYVWVTSVYLVASVLGAAMVGPLLTRLGPRRGYLVALLSFAVGSALCALAPQMALLLAGRVVQGFSGGVLAGLGYAVISSALPERLWTRGAAVVSAMWGVGTLVGPVTGGLIADHGRWRAGFGALAALASLLAVLVLVVLPAVRASPAVANRVAWPSLILLGLSALAVSAAVAPRDPLSVALLLALAVLLAIGFLAVDRRVSTTVLPRNVFGPGPLKWSYATMGALMAATMVDLYIPLFGQRLDGLSPMIAGFLGAALSVGWTVGEIRSASITRRATAVTVVALAPVVMAAGLAVTAAVQRDGASAVMVTLCAASLATVGVGIGMAWPHLSVWALASAEDGQQEAAGAAITTVQLMSGAFGAGLAGIAVNLRSSPDAGAARILLACFAVLALLATAPARRAGRPG